MVGARLPIVARGFLMASLLHSLFDLLLLTADRLGVVFRATHSGYSRVVLLGALAHQISQRHVPAPRRHFRMPLRCYCQECGLMGTAGTRCAECGALITEPEELDLCPICSIAQRPGAMFCSRCGTNVILPAKKTQDPPALRLGLVSGKRAHRLHSQRSRSLQSAAHSATPSSSSTLLSPNVMRN